MYEVKLVFIVYLMAGIIFTTIYLVSKTGREDLKAALDEVDDKKLRPVWGVVLPVISTFIWPVFLIYEKLVRNK